MRVREILRLKGSDLHTIGPQATLNGAIVALVRHQVGSLIVLDPSWTGSGRRLLGIVTERDVLRAHAENPTPMDELFVEEIMTCDPVTTSPEAHLHESMRLMTYHRIRHLPVLDEENLLGVISIGDVLKAHHDMLEMENHYMKSYIQGDGADVNTPA